MVERPGGGEPAARRFQHREDLLGELVPARRPWWGYLWAAPNTLVGLVGAATVRATPRRWRGVLLLEEARGGLARFLAWRGFAAITLGHVMIVNRKASDHLLAHELAHVRQHERWGLAFYPAYLLVSVRGYRRNPFELAARKVEEGIRKLREELGPDGGS
jgi:Domain of unknown function (DUF4157)